MYLFKIRRIGYESGFCESGLNNSINDSIQFKMCSRGGGGGGSHQRGHRWADGTNIYRHRLYAISGNSPVPKFFPGNGKFFQDPGKTSPVNIPSTKLEEDTHGTVSVNTMSRLVVYHMTSTLTRGVAGSGHA